MKNLLISLNVVLPLFLMMATGYIAAKAKAFSPELVSKMNGTVFRIFMPSLLFRQIYTLDLEKDINPGLIAFALISLGLIILISLIIVPRAERDRKKAGAVIQALYRGNFILFGLAISTAVYGDRATGSTAVLMAIVTPIFNAVSVVILDYFRAAKPDLKEVFIDVIKTPCIIASILAAVLLALGVKLPETVMGVVTDVGNVTTPLALILLGATFTVKGLFEYKKHITAVCALKLFIIPAAVLGVAALLGFRNESLVAILSMTATPIAVSSFTVAEIMNSDGELAAQLVISTSAVSVVSIFLLVFTLKSLALI